MEGREVSEPALCVKLSAGYGKTAVLDGVDLTLHAGECLGLVGGSGAGKSTLVLALLGLLPWRRGWARGEVLLGSQSGHAQRNLLALPEREARRLRGREIALIPQSPASALNPALSLFAQLTQAWRAHQPGTAGMLARAQELLAKVQLPSGPAFLARKPGQISVGQAQRFTLALALLHRPSVLVADEPTSALDPVTQREVLDLLRSVQRSEGTALLYISHDILSVLDLCDRVAVLEGGKVVASQRVAMLGTANLHASLNALLATVPVPVDVLLRHLRDRAAQAGAPVSMTEPTPLL